MRHLSYPEAALAISCILLGSGLAYLGWLKPAFEQMHSDRQATQTLLFELASARREVAVKAMQEGDTAPIPSAAPSAPKPTQPTGRTKKQGFSKRSRPDRQVLELDEGSDPLADLEAK